MPKLTSLFLLVSFAIFSQNLKAFKPSLQVAEAFNILAVNGSPYSKGLFKQQRLLSLRKGKNLIAFEYEEVFESEDDDNFDIVKSAPFVAEFYVNQDGQYIQRLLKPSDLGAAKRFSQNPVFEIIETSDKGNPIKIAVRLRVLHGTGDSYLAQETRLKQKPRLDLSHPSPKSGKKETVAPTATNQTPSMASKMLKYWWQQATPAERQAFLSSIEK